MPVNTPVDDESEDQLSSIAAECLVDYEQAKANGSSEWKSQLARATIGPEVACVDLLHRVWPEFRPTTEGAERLPWKILGDFRLLREIGRGGMGKVFEAEQISMGRQVALKVLPFATLARENSLKRFRNEVRAAAALEHPHIVSVYSVGDDRGIHYYAMRLISGQSLAEVISELRKAPGSSNNTGREDSAYSHTNPAATPTAGKLQALVRTAIDSKRESKAFWTAARIGIQAAEALQHAHDQGILHRDIKPSNLMLDADGKVYVTDFGLARIETDAGMTMTGEIIGTLRYMAPEQALAKRVVVDHRADIYSLGATLYELLTLQPALEETDRKELLKQIAFEEPRPLRKLDSKIPAELETIVLKAMAKCPEDRYQSAQLLADDLRAFVDNRPIQAKPPSWRDHLVKWTRRHPAAFLMAAVFLLAATIVSASCAILVTRAYQREAAQREIAVAERQRAQESLVIARSAINKSTTQLVNNLVGHAGVGVVVERFLQDGLKFYDSLLKVSNGNPEIENSRSQYLIIMSKARAQDYRFDDARKYYEEAMKTIRGLVDRYPNEQSYRKSLEAAETTKALWVSEFGQYDEAVKLQRTAVAYRRARLALAPSSAEGKDSLVGELFKLMRFQSVAGDRRGAIQTWTEADALCAELIALGEKEDARYWYRHFRALGLVRRGSVLAKMGRYQESAASFQSAFEIERILVAEKPATTAYSITLENALQGLAEIAVLQKDPEAALKFIEEAEAIRRSKERPIAVPDLFWTMLFVKARVQAELGRNEDSLETIQKAFDNAKTSSSLHNLNDAAWNLATSPQPLCRNGGNAVVLATKICELTAYENPDFVATLAAALAESGDFAGAIQWSQKAAELSTDVTRREKYERHLERFKLGEPWREL